MTNPLVEVSVELKCSECEGDGVARPRYPVVELCQLCKGSGDGFTQIETLMAMRAKWGEAVETFAEATRGFSKELDDRDRQIEQLRENAGRDENAAFANDKRIQQLEAVETFAEATRGFSKELAERDETITRLKADYETYAGAAHRVLNEAKDFVIAYFGPRWEPMSEETKEDTTFLSFVVSLAVSLAEHSKELERQIQALQEERAKWAHAAGFPKGAVE